MDSTLYDSIEEKKDVSFDLDNVFPFSLDPELENSVDLQELISSTLTTDHLPIEHVDAQSLVLSIPTEESHVVVDNTTDFEVQCSDFDFLAQSAVHMPKAENFNICDTASTPVTIKVEDLGTLGLASCQGLETYQVAASPVSSAEVSTSSVTISEAQRERKPSGKTSRKRKVEKGTDEYVEKRARNNIAVRKSRDKAKDRQKETEERVVELNKENEQLQKKVDLLTKELNVLKGLFINVGAALPSKFAELVEKAHSK